METDGRDPARTLASLATRCLLSLATIALLVGDGIAGAPGPAAPPRAEASSRAGTAADARADAGKKPAPASLDDAFAEVARLVPEFGGFYFAHDGTLYAVLLDTRAEVLSRAAAAILTVFGPEARLPLDGLQAAPGQFGFSALHAMRLRARAVLAVPGVISLDIDERENRLAVGVVDKRAIAAAQKRLAELGVPPPMVRVTRVPPVTPVVGSVSFLREEARPLVGGVQIDGAMGNCTLGFLAQRSGVRGFVMASHCTFQSTLGGVLPTSVWQPEQTGTDKIGVESVDPMPFTGGACPAGRQCRWSDSAFVTIQPGITGRIGRIAHPTGPVQSSPYRVTGEAPAPVLGQVVTKVGRTTAETSGEVTATCADINPEYTLLNAAYPGNLTLLCQHRFAAESDRGDSGGPVFAPIGASLDVDLHGVLSGTELGGDQPGSWFSALGQIEVDLGNLLPEMSNQAPVVEIIAPADGAMIGSGSFVDVTFEASYFDFEDGYACTNCVSWYSSVDGPLGNSSVVQGVATLQVMLNGTGPRLITAWAWDGSAAADTDTISVHIGNMAPQVSILAPQDGAALVQGFTYVFQGDSFDPELFHALPCGSLTWTSSNPADAIHNHPGCALSASFATIGPRTITLTGVDADAVSAADTIAIDVVPPPSNAPPVVTILHPANNALLAPQTLIALTGKIQDPDGLSPIAYQWILTRGSTQTVLGTGQAQSGHNVMLFWTPASNVPFHCGGSAVTIHLVATDLGNDTGWDSVNATVHFPAC